MIVTGDLNVYLERTEKWVQDEEIAAVISTAELEDLAGHFLLRPQILCKDWRMWAMARERRVVRSQTATF